MKVIDLIRMKQEERGISVAELSRRTNVKYEALRTALAGTRGLDTEEFVALCRELHLDIHDFDGCALMKGDNPECEVA